MDNLVKLSGQICCPHCRSTVCEVSPFISLVALSVIKYRCPECGAILWEGFIADRTQGIEELVKLYGINVREVSCVGE